MRYFVVSDLHGELDALVSLTKHWNEEEEKLLFIGDLLDRGPHSLPIMNFAMNCVKDEKAIWLKGNHELMFLNFLDNPMSFRDYLSPFVGMMDTIGSFISDLIKKGYKEEQLSDLVPLVNIINKEYSELISFIRNLPLYHVDGPFLFVHAAIEVDVENIDEVDEDVLLWGDRDFLNEEPHKLDKIVIFGHTPTQNLGEEGKVFFSFDRKKIGIDGGGFIETPTASVNAISIDTCNSNEISVFNYNVNSKKIESYFVKLNEQL